MTKNDEQDRQPARKRLNRRAIMQAVAFVPTDLPQRRSGVADADQTRADGEIIWLCMLARRLDDLSTEEASEQWDRTVYRVSELQARHQAALLAKARLLLTLSPDGDAELPGRDRPRLGPEEALLVSLLRDLLATDPSEALIAEIERRDKAEEP